MTAPTRRRFTDAYLGAILLVMAVAQASDLAGFHDVIRTYGLGGLTSWPLTIGLLAGAAVAGIGLLRRRRSTIPATVALTVAAVWTVLAVQAFARGLDLDNCGCFGVHLAQPLRWWVLLEDVWFVGLALWVWRDARRDVTQPVGPAAVPSR